MDLRGFLRLLARRWPTILVCALLGTGAGVAATAATTPVYEATAQIFVSTQTTEDSTQLNQGNAFTQARVQSYAEIAATRQITKPVIKQLGLDMTPDQLAGKITAEAPLNTVLINLSVQDINPRQAAKIANAVASRFGDVVGDLESPNGGGPSPVKLGVTNTATVPASPISPKPLLNISAGLLLGIVAGTGLVLLRETLDTSVKTTEALAEITGLAALGAIPYDKAARGRLIAAGPEAFGARAEAYRQLRTNLQFAQVDRRPRVIVVTSALSGEGKTSTAANLALALAETGRRVCLVDADLRCPRVAGVLGLVQDAGLTSVLIGAATADEVMQSVEGKCSVLTSGPIPPNPAELLASERMGQTLRDLAEIYDTVVVDSAPLLPVADTSGLVPAADGVLLVVRAGSTPHDRVRAAASALQKVGARTLGVVLSMAQTRKVKGYGYGYGGYGGLAPATRGKAPRPQPAPPKPAAEAKPLVGAAADRSVERQSS